MSFTMREKILVVDDETEIVDLVRASLSSEFNVVGLSDPDRVMEELNSGEFELVILDINLGSISGYELCEQVQSLHPGTTVVFLSSLTGERDVVRAYEVGGFDFICKPFRPKELLEKISKLMAIRLQLLEERQSNQASRQVAMDAMSLASRYGMIVSFLDTNVETRDIEALMRSLSETIAGLNLQHAVVCYNESGQLLYSNASPLEESFMTVLKDQGRIADHCQRSVFSADCVRILIKNMPLDNPSEYGIIKDILAPLVTGASSRVKSILMHNSLIKASEEIVSATSVLQNMSEQSSALAKMVEAYLLDMQSTLVIIEMSEEQEQYVLSQADEHMNAIADIVREQSASKDSLKTIIGSISDSL